VTAQATRTRRREQRENTRREILGGADRLLRDRPFRELTVEAVMADTDLTRTAFYRHFEDITALVLALLGEVEKELHVIAERWVAHVGEGFPAPAHAGLRGTVEFFQRHGPLMRAIDEAAATDAEIERGYRDLLEQFIELTARGLDAYIGEHGDHSVDTEQLARALNVLNVRYLLDQFGREPYGDPALALRTLELIWTGTATQLRPPESPS
jgi:AcrR family transcriptional regulator